MNLRLGALSLSSFIIGCAGWLVPGRERAEWAAEWEAELWHAGQALRGGSFSEARGVIEFSLGAFPDAFWVRRNASTSLRHRVMRPGSASRCSISLAAWSAASLLFCLLLPGANNAMRRSFTPERDGLVMISRGGYSGSQLPTIGFQEYRLWKTSARHLFTGLAFYQPILKRVHISRHRAVELSIGRTSDNLFQLLSLSPQGGGRYANSRNAARVFLTKAAWQENFAGDREILGSFADIGGQHVLIAGIVDENSLRLPGRVDAWLLEDEPHLAMLSSKSGGFVLGQLRTAGSANRSRGWQYMTVNFEEGGSERFDCISLTEQNHLPFSVFLFTLIVALIALPATTPLPLGEYPRHTGRLTWTGRARRWVFLWSKIFLLVLLVHFTAVDAAYGHAQSEVNAQYIQLTVSFFGFLFGFRWILRDQRKRCPVCLRVLSNPARVGEASRCFLAWNGTELICAAGHGLLHIPELPTSWFDTQRWLDLDASWGTLFTDSCVPSVGIV
ncbi:MAG: hypothetical protein WA510_00165 [Acidobacteriaceae bacterium]